MGRSVSYASGSCERAFETIESTEDSGDFDWDMFREDVAYRGRAVAKSFRDCDKWVGREDHAILENEFAYLGLSEYMGLVCIWLLPKEGDDYGDEYKPLRERWLSQIAPKFHKVFGTLNKVGTFSNGEAVFTRKGAAK
jgi:hypothetical protein